jgi:nitrilase
MRLTIPLILASAIAAAPLSSPDYNNLTVALVRAAPANWPAPILNKNWTDVSLDLDATITFAVDLISEAATTGANLVVFPETWFPG